MPISTNNTNVTIEFTWQSEEDPTLSLMVKHHVVKGVNMISVTQDNKSWYQFQASFFSEVTGFLSSQNILANKQPVMRNLVTQQPEQYQQPQQQQWGPLVSNNSQPGQIALENNIQGSGGVVLPKPNIIRTVDENGTLEPMEVAEMEPIENLRLGGINIAPTAMRTPPDRPAVAINRPVVRGDEATARMLRGSGGGEKPVRRT